MQTVKTVCLRQYGDRKILSDLRRDVVVIFGWSIKTRHFVKRSFHKSKTFTLFGSPSSRFKHRGFLFHLFSMFVLQTKKEHYILFIAVQCLPVNDIGTATYSLHESW